MKRSLLTIAAFLAIGVCYAQEKEIKKSEKMGDKSVAAQDANARDDSRKAARQQRKMMKKQDKAGNKASMGK